MQKARSTAKEELPTAQQGAGATTKQPAGPKTTSVSAVDPVHDSVPNSFASSVVLLGNVSTSHPTAKAVTADLVALENQKSIDWGSDNNTGMFKLVSENLPSGTACLISDKTQVFVFHVTHWKPGDGGQAQLVSSSWFAYTLHNGGTLRFASLSGQGDQSVYGKTRALIIGIAGFDETKTGALTAFQETYLTSVLQGTPENETNFGALISSLGGFASVKGAGFDSAGAEVPVVLSVGCQVGTAKLPFTLTVTDSTISKAGDKAPQPPSADALTCSGKNNVTPCASTHSFQSEDKEYWDISIGMALPGVREAKFGFTNSTVTTSTTTHTDLYGMLDIYWAGHWKPKDSIIPHPFFGLPVTSQTFYRPLFGMSETLTGWCGLQRRLSLPIAINVFAGLVDMKTSSLTDSPTTQAQFNTDLKQTRVWKGVYGIEVPISSLANKLGKKSSPSAKGQTPVGSTTNP